VMDTAFQLTEVHGPRLHGTASLLSAAEWARDRLELWGSSKAHLESWDSQVPVWELESYTVEMTSPRYMRFNAHPVVWTPSTLGVVEGVPMVVKVRSEDDFAALRGTMRGRIVFNDAIDPPVAEKAGAVERFSDERLRQLLSAIDTGPEPGFWKEWNEWEVELDKWKKIVQFFREEGVAVLVEPSARVNGIVRVSYSGWESPDENAPSFVIARESWDMVSRLVESGVEPVLRLESRVRIEDGAKGFNVLAEIPGTDPVIGDQVVLLGGHLDGWVSGTGASDNAAGSAVSMEVMRILLALGVEPRRTIRVALWDGEEFDYGGSLDYVTRHLADIRTMQLKPDHADFSGYFNLDNGTGKIRGVYLQGNEFVRPIFESWLEPFRYLEAETLTSENTSGTDHIVFDAVGVPGFSFIQDPLSYGTVTHHTDQDVYNQLDEDNLKQASVIMASFVYHAAMRDDLLPRKALPEPLEDDPPEAD
jgi:carboxypeptidase Q